MEAQVRHSVKLGVATAAAAVALLGGAATASACSYDEGDPNWASLCDDESPQVTCQFGDDDESLIIYQTNNISVGHDFDGDLDVAFDGEPT
ncbi:hypothetical protein [Streptomyces gibsoniae]|uniref:Uncharacterized protein n=1 Tax=Streptomyces gibsoniae TaxID=3075529 RepID=A0ABU2U3C5_9ACTN|nr:hypothetical protein [Streptomyces sp. DSM 41699]MDT0467566.1 hypothetical protein [Streptomyces sp. DSM 41699]